MIRVKLTSIMVDNQDRARSFYTEKLGFSIKHDIPLGGASWLTLVAGTIPMAWNFCWSRQAIRRQAHSSRRFTATEFR